MKFQVPQFIEVEDKIFGPLSLKQFLYLAGGGAAVFLLYVILPFFIFVLLAPPVAAFAGALAFYKINNKPFISVVENAISYFRTTKIYIWKKREKPLQQEQVIRQKTPAAATENIPELTQRKISDLAWSLDIKKNITHDREENL